MIRQHILPIKSLGQRGVSFIEVLLVMGMLSIFLMVMATIFTATIDTQTQTQGYSATLSDGRFIMARLNYDIARASAINTPASLGNTTASLVMTIGGNSYTYALSGSKLQLTDATGTADLSDYNATVSALSFQRLGNTGGKETIRYSFTITATAQQGSGAQTQTFTSTVERR
jgi:hypothetical protein